MNYREVKCSDRLPEKDTKCYTDVGFAEYCGDDNWIVDYPEAGFVFGKNVVKFWLEPYELPTEEEIIAIMNEARYEKHIHPNGNTIYPHLAGYNFKKVAKAINNLLKGER